MDADVSEEDDTYRPPRSKTSKSVRFEDLLDAQATGNFADIRQSMKREDERSRRKMNVSSSHKIYIT